MDSLISRRARGKKITQSVLPVMVFCLGIDTYIHGRLSVQKITRQEETITEETPGGLQGSPEASMVLLPEEARTV